MWISPDPMGFVDGWDRWMYVGGDPVNFVDPLGWGSTGNLVGGAQTPHADPPPAFGFGHLFDHPRDDWNLFREELTSSASRVGDSLAGVGGGVLDCALHPLACVGGAAENIRETYNNEGTVAALGEASGLTTTGEMLGEGLGGIYAYANGDTDEDGLQDAILTTTGGSVSGLIMVSTASALARHGSTVSHSSQLPQSIGEAAAASQVVFNPTAGITVPVMMGDSRWRAADGWIKMQQEVAVYRTNTVFHYVYNTATGAVDDIKIAARIPIR
jgi:filamentous hemagglutinin